MEQKILQAKEELGEIYSLIIENIKSRIAEFRDIGEKGDDDRIFMELVFCLLTPASKAKNAWMSVINLHKNGLLYDGTVDEISNYLNTVRFKNNKAKNIVLARSLLYENKEFKFNLLFNNFRNDAFKLREWFVSNIRGMAYKESTHFLRNIGKSGELCILDRHILRNLCYYRVIDKVPSSLSPQRYLDIENRMQKFSKQIGIPITDLDLILWYKETGEIFK